MKEKLFRKNDLILLIAVLLVAAISALCFFGSREDGDVAVVLVNGEEYGRYSLGSDLELPIDTAESGRNLLVIKDGSAQVIDANCPDRICVSHREISSVGETIVCLPHKLVVRIEAENKGDTPDIVG